MQELSTQQTNVLQVITDYKNKYGYPPTQEEIASELSIQRTTVQEHLKRLEKKGYISRNNPRKMIELTFA